MGEHGPNAWDHESRANGDSLERSSARPILVPLMEQMRAGGASYQSAVPTVIRHVEPGIRAFVRRRATRIGRDDAFVDDVVQDTLALVATRGQQCRATTDREAMAWMLCVAQTALADTLRRDGPPQESVDDARFDVDMTVSFDESIGRRPVASPGLEILLRVAVEVSGELSAADATLLWMRLVAEEDWAAVGASLGISATAARRRFQRMQQGMRRRIRAALQSLPPDAQRIAHQWLRKHLNEHADADAPPVAEDPRD